MQASSWTGEELTGLTVNWSPSTFRLVGSQIAGGTRALGYQGQSSPRALESYPGIRFDHPTGTSVDKNFSEATKRVQTHRAWDTAHYLFSHPNAVSYRHLVRYPHPRPVYPRVDADGSGGPDYRGGHDGDVADGDHNLCMMHGHRSGPGSQGTFGADDNSANPNFFGRGYSDSYTAGAEPSSLGAYVTYFFAVRERRGDQTDAIRRMVGQGFQYLTEDTERGGSGGSLVVPAVDVPRSSQANHQNLDWQCVVPGMPPDEVQALAPIDPNAPEETEEEDRIRIRPHSEQSAEDARRTGVGVSRCPELPGQGVIEVDFEGRPGRMYEVFVGAMLVPRRFVGETLAVAREKAWATMNRDGLMGLAHMADPEVYTMPFDDHSGTFRRNSGANVVLPDAIRGTGTQRANLLNRREAINAGPSIVFRTIADRCYRVDGTSTNSRVHNCTNKTLNPECANVVDPRDECTSSTGFLSTHTLRNNSIRDSNISHISTSGGMNRFLALPYGQTITALLTFVPDVPERPIFQMRCGESFCGNQDIFDGVPGGGRDFPDVVALNDEGQIRMRIRPFLGYGLNTTYILRRTNLTDAGDPVDIALDVPETARSAGEAHGLVAPVGTGWVNVQIAAEPGKAYSLEAIAENSLGRNRGFAGVRRVLASEPPEVAELEVTALGARRIGASWELESDGGTALERFEYRYQQYGGTDPAACAAPSTQACSRGGRQRGCRCLRGLDRQRAGTRIGR